MLDVLHSYPGVGKVEPENDDDPSLERLITPAIIRPPVRKSSKGKEHINNDRSSRQLDHHPRPLATKSLSRRSMEKPKIPQSRSSRQLGSRTAANDGQRQQTSRRSMADPHSRSRTPPPPPRRSPTNRSSSTRRLAVGVNDEPKTDKNREEQQASRRSSRRTTVDIVSSSSSSSSRPRRRVHRSESPQRNGSPMPRGRRPVRPTDPSPPPPPPSSRRATRLRRRQKKEEPKRRGVSRSLSPDSLHRNPPKETISAQDAAAAAAARPSFRMRRARPSTPTGTRRRSMGHSNAAVFSTEARSVTRRVPPPPPHHPRSTTPTTMLHRRSSCGELYQRRHYRASSQSPPKPPLATTQQSVVAHAQEDMTSLIASAEKDMAFATTTATMTEKGLLSSKDNGMDHHDKLFEMLLAPPPKLPPGFAMPKPEPRKTSPPQLLRKKPNSSRRITTTKNDLPKPPPPPSRKRSPMMYRGNSMPQLNLDDLQKRNSRI